MNRNLDSVEPEASGKDYKQAMRGIKLHLSSPDPLHIESIVQPKQCFKKKIEKLIFYLNLNLQIK